MATQDPVIRADDASDEPITAEELKGNVAPQVPADDGLPTAQKPRDACKFISLPTHLIDS